MRHPFTGIAVLALTLLATPALAEDAAQSTAQMQLDTKTTASTGTPAGFGTVMGALRNSKNSANAIQTLSAVGSVRIVKVAGIVGADDMPLLEQAIVEYQSDITGLQAAIMANNALKSAIDAELVDTSNIVAANIEADGGVTVFVK